MKILEMANKPIIIIIIIITNTMVIIIIIIIKIILIIIITIIKVIETSTSITRIQIIRGIVTTLGIIKTSKRIIIRKLVINKKRIRRPSKIIKRYPLQYKIIFLKLRRGS